MNCVLPKFILAAGLVALPLHACRYSVRDTGFVDFESAPYRLRVDSRSLPPAVFDVYRQAAAIAFADANVVFEADDAAAPDSGLVVTDTTGRRFVVAPPDAIPRGADEVRRLVDSVAMSPVRNSLQQESLRSFAVVLIVEGTRPAANVHATESALAAIRSVERLLPGMPKPVAVPPQLISIPVSQQPSEALLIWGLGLDPGTTPDPRLTIVYGRGRRLGARMEGPAITRTAIQERLVLIGQDCECDLDRAWLQGPVIPGRWDRGLQEIAARTLGFDPENPRVRSEVSRIVLRGDGEKRRQSPPTTALALGYSEESVDAPATTAAPPESEAPTHVPAPGSSTNPPDARGTPASASKPETRGSRPLWVMLVAGVGAAFGAGIWIAWRGTRKL